MSRVALVVVLAGCGGGSSPPDAPPPPPCTIEDQDVPEGAVALEVESIDLGFDGGACPPTKLYSSQGMVDADFGGTPPAQLAAANIDFAVDRLILGSSNPVLRFAALLDPPNQLFVAEEPLCQGIPPSCVAYVLRGVTSDLMTLIGCPYTGPEPCLAP